MSKTRNEHTARQRGKNIGSNSRRWRREQERLEKKNNKMKQEIK